MLEAVEPYLATDYRVKSATEDWERRGAMRLRRAVFCTEQGVFESDDSDLIDTYALPIVAFSMMAGEPDEVVGSVRIHEAEKAAWWGSRLAVAAPFRRVGALGSGLVKMAVGAAKAQGCCSFRAEVQAQNRALFERLHWQALVCREVHGRLHWLMEADLNFYSEVRAPQLGVGLRRKALS